MGKPLQRWPKWSEAALQGLAFWIGHRHSLYPHYPLGESALVAETCNLLFANLEPEQELYCEQQYTDLLPKTAWPRDYGIRSRADLVVVNRPSHADPVDIAKNLYAVIEVKRATAPKAQIDQDLKRLAVVKHARPRVRAFLFVVAEAHRPKRFTIAEGRAWRKDFDIQGANAHYRVRRACKAAAAFTGKESAHYACLIEVYRGRV